MNPSDSVERSPLRPITAGEAGSGSDLIWIEAMSAYLAEVTGRRRDPRPVKALDVAAARSELAANGLVVLDLDEIANRLADGDMDLVAPSLEWELEDKVTTLTVATLLALTTLLFAGLMLVTSLVYGVDMNAQTLTDLDPQQFGTLCAGYVIFGCSITFMVPPVWRLILSRSPRARAATESQLAAHILENHIVEVPITDQTVRSPSRVRDILETTGIELGAAGVRTAIDRATTACEQIRSHPVWESALFDSHRVRVDLDAELSAITSRLRRLVSVDHFTEGRESKKMTAAVLASTWDRIRALEAYQVQVLEAQAACDRLRRAEASEAAVDRLGDLMAATGADALQVDHLGALSAEARAATAALSEVLTMMTSTIGIFAPTVRPADNPSAEDLPEA